MVRPKSALPLDTFVSIRMSAADRADMETSALSEGLTLSQYLRKLHFLGRQTEGHFEEIGPSDEAPNYDAARLSTVFSTDHGQAICGNGLDYLHAQAAPGSIDLIMTSPPFGLVREKSYGNEHANDYCDWFRPFAEGFRRVLKESGSLVIDIGGSWNAGTPTRSLYHFELLLMLCREYGFHLCQEHFWWNPAKLPTPAEWVNIRRIRVKDAVNCVWWLSPSPWPKANNRRVLAPYSSSMRHLLKNGYTARLRPSGHDISDQFITDNGGAVPPNLLAMANTESNGRYQDYCRQHGLEIHPARFPALLPEYFIRMLTDKGDAVVDPFGGSCVTGMVAEALERKWTCVDLSIDYLQGAKGRFIEGSRYKAQNVPTRYSIAQPCGVPYQEVDVPFSDDGGRKRAPRVARDKPVGPRGSRLTSRHIQGSASTAPHYTALPGDNTYPEGDIKRTIHDKEK